MRLPPPPGMMHSESCQSPSPLPDGSRPGSDAQRAGRREGNEIPQSCTVCMYVRMV